MSCQKPGQTEHVEASRHLPHVDRRRCGGAQHRQPSIRLRSLIWRAARFAAFCALAVVGWGSQSARAEQPDFSVYARAVEFCRSIVKRPLALDLDHRILCFDGTIRWDQDMSLVKGLLPGGLFVVRSPGGIGPTAIALADLLAERQAIVVVYDYCVSACANYLLVASAETFVMKDTLVAWHLVAAPLCPSLEISRDGGPKRLEKKPCADSPPKYQEMGREIEREHEQFFAKRAVAPPIEWPPESFTIRKTLRSMFEGAGVYPDVIWTWHPRYYSSLIKTKIIYEAYPESQGEVDALALKLGMGRVLYDP